MLPTTISYLRTKLHNFFVEESAATTVEYALLLALIMVFCISAILSSGDVQQALWFNTATSIEVINQ